MGWAFLRDFLFTIALPLANMLGSQASLRSRLDIKVSCTYCQGTSHIPSRFLHLQQSRMAKVRKLQARPCCDSMSAFGAGHLSEAFRRKNFTEFPNVLILWMEGALLLALLQTSWYGITDVYNLVASWLPHVTTHAQRFALGHSCTGLPVVAEHPGSDVFLSICGNVWRFGASTSEAHCCWKAQ